MAGSSRNKPFLLIIYHRKITCVPTLHITMEKVRIGVEMATKWTDATMVLIGLIPALILWVYLTIKFALGFLGALFTFSGGLTWALFLMNSPRSSWSSCTTSCTTSLARTPLWTHPSS